MGLAILASLVIILAILAAIGYLIAIYNSLVRLRNDIDKAWANIGVLLKQRHDELPKLMETCKAYMQHEEKTLREIIEARTAFRKAETVPEKAQAHGRLSEALGNLFALAKSYPDLKGNRNFTQLQSRILELEAKIAERRELFNDDVNAYNSRIQELPEVLIARTMKLAPKDGFRLAEEEGPRDAPGRTQ